MSELVVAVDLGGTNIKAALVDRNGRVLINGRSATKAENGASSVCSRIVSLVKKLFKRQGVSAKDLLSLGIGVPGPLDSKTGVVLRCPNMPDWENYNLAKRLTAALKLPVHIENDANAAALAEAWLGAGKGCKHVVCLTLGTGVGCGLVIDGRIMKGQGQGAELGHMIVREGGRLCGCGARGCLEAYASAGAVSKRAIEALQEGGPAVKASLLAGKEPSCKDVFQQLPREMLWPFA